MPKTIKYTGTERNWRELPVTGKQSVWLMQGQQEERSDAEANLLLGTGLFTEVFSLDDLPLPSLVSGAGATAVATEFPAERVSIAATGCVCASPCAIARIRCTSGAAVNLVVYDNPAASTGTQLYNGSLSAGQEAAITAPITAINGLRAVFASGAFDFYISQEA